METLILEKFKKAMIRIEGAEADLAVINDNPHAKIQVCLPADIPKGTELISPPETFTLHWVTASDLRAAAEGNLDLAMNKFKERLLHEADVLKELNRKF